MDGEQGLVRGDAEGIRGDLEDQRQNTQSRSALEQAFHHQPRQLPRRLAILVWIDIAAQQHAEHSQDGHTKPKPMKATISRG